MILPKVPSQLIRIALEDMKATIAQGIKIRMDSWGDGDTSMGNCSVCFAGSVMLQRTNVGVAPRNFNAYQDEKNECQYLFLDRIRQGRLDDAMNYLDIEVENTNDNSMNLYQWTSLIPNWVDYNSDNQEEFFKQVEQLADLLETKGY